MVIKILAVNKSLTDRRTVYFSHKISLEIVSAIKDADSVSTFLLFSCILSHVARWLTHPNFKIIIFKKKKRIRSTVSALFIGKSKAFPAAVSILSLCLIGQSKANSNYKKVLVNNYLGFLGYITDNGSCKGKEG